MVVAQAARLDLSEALIREIGLAALLHDIGKELVPAEILNKPGKLDTGEFAKSRSTRSSGRPTSGSCPSEAIFRSSYATNTTSGTTGPGTRPPASPADLIPRP